MDENTLKILLNQRQRRAEEALAHWSAAQQQTEHSRRIADQLDAARRAAGADTAAAHSVTDIRLRQGFGVRLHDVCDQAARQVTQAQSQEDRQRHHFTEQRKERLVIEKLQERLINRRAQAQLKAERTMLEDFVGARHGR